MRLASLRIPAVLLIAVSAIGLTPLLATAQQMYLDLEIPGGPKSAAVPGNCSGWHELWPAFCAPHHQDDYYDNGDGDVSACDYIKLDGRWYHIVWSGPTYYLSCATGQSALEPTDPGTGGDPTCEIWQEVHPNHGAQFHVDGWQDNGDGVLSACDYVMIAGQVCHIDRIGLNITVVPGDPPTPTRQSTWGKIKGFFGSAF